MDGSNWISEQRIRAAMEEGQFDNLPGHGKPLNLDDNPHEPEDMRMANSLLRNNNFLPPWMEIGAEIDGELEAARSRYRSSYQLGEAQARMEFSTAITALNRRILDYNLRVPSDVFQRRTLEVQREIDAIHSAG